MGALRPRKKPAALRPHCASSALSCSDLFCRRHRGPRSVLAGRAPAKTLRAGPRVSAASGEGDQCACSALTGGQEINGTCTVRWPRGLRVAPSKGTHNQPSWVDVSSCFIAPPQTSSSSTGPFCYQAQLVTGQKNTRCALPTPRFPGTMRCSTALGSAFRGVSTRYSRLVRVSGAHR